MQTIILPYLCLVFTASSAEGLQLQDDNPHARSTTGTTVASSDNLSSLIPYMNVESALSFARNTDERKFEDCRLRIAVIEALEMIVNKYKFQTKKHNIEEKEINIIEARHNSNIENKIAEIMNAYDAGLYAFSLTVKLNSAAHKRAINANEKCRIYLAAECEDFRNINLEVEEDKEKFRKYFLKYSVLHTEFCKRHGIAFSDGIKKKIFDIKNFLRDECMPPYTNELTPEEQGFECESDGI